MIPNKFETYCLEFFKSLETLNLSLSFRAKPKIDELPDYIIDEFQKYSLLVLHLDRPLKDKSSGHLLLINKMDSIYFMDKIYKSQTCLFSEINTNLKRSNSKEELLIYLYEVEHALSRILKGFYNTDLPWVYNKEVLTYRITFPPELEDEDERSKKHPQVHKFLGVFDDLNIYFRNTIDQIYDKIKLYIKQTEILPETSFSRLKGEKLQATVVALYYYYLIEAGVNNEEYGTTLNQFRAQYDEIRQLQAKLLSEYNELIDERLTHYERLKAYETEISELPYLRRENDRLRKQVEVLSNQLETAKTNLLGYSLCKQREEQLQAKVQSLQEQNEELRQQIQTLERLHSTAQDLTHKLNLLSESQDNTKQLIIQLADKNTSVLERLLPSLITAGSVLFQNKKSDEIIQMLRQNLTSEQPHSLASPVIFDMLINGIESDEIF